MNALPSARPLRVGARYVAWDVAGVDRTWPWIGFACDDPQRVVVDVTTQASGERDAAEHPSLSRIIDRWRSSEDDVGDVEERWWVREHVGGVDLALLLDRAREQGATTDVDMSLWLTECIGRASAAAFVAFPELAATVVRFNGLPFLLEGPGRHFATARTFETNETRTATESLVALFALSINPRATVRTTLFDAALPERVRRVAWRADTARPDELLEAIRETRTVAPDQLCTAWAGVVAQLAPEERRAHEELLEELALAEV